MTTVPKPSNPLIVPLSIRRRAGLKPGDRLEFKASRGIITIVGQNHTPDDEETPRQRGLIDAQLAEGLADFRSGRVSARLDTVDQMLASLKGTSRTGTRKTVLPGKTRSR